MDGGAFVRRYLDEVFSEGNLTAMDDYLAGDKFKEGVASLEVAGGPLFPTSSWSSTT